jgi:hypothetical protein
MIPDKEGMRRLTKEISAVIESNLRAEILHERKAMLETELAKVRAEFGQLGKPRPAGVRRPVRKATRPIRAGARRIRAGSAHSLMMDILKRTGKALTINELAQALKRRGWKSLRADPKKTIDVALRKYTADFHKVRPGTFELTH